MLKNFNDFYSSNVNQSTANAQIDTCHCCSKDEYFKITYLVEYQEGDGVFQSSKPYYCPNCGRYLKGE